MPKKKPKQNPYIFFCLEKKQIDESLKDKALPELVALCSQEWERMSSDQRKPYYETAKQMAEGRIQPTFTSSETVENSPVNDLCGKFDAFGRSFLMLQEQRKTAKLFSSFAKQDTRRTIELEGEKMVEFRFHIMTVNHWLELDTTGDIIPVELALVEMSLRDGITRKFVQHIDPGELPKGYAADMKINSEKFHDIWLDMPQLTSSYRDIVESIKKILYANPKEFYAGEGIKFPSDHPPNCLSFARFHRLLPIYVVPDDKKVVTKALKWLTNQNDSTKDYDFVIYDLVYLFQQLVQTAPFEAPSKFSMGAAESYLLRDVFLYLPSMSCHFHRKIESSKCAGSRACRFAHIICDFACQMYGIRPKEGGHLPWGIAPEKVVIDTPNTSRASSSFSSNSSVGAESLNFIADSVSANFTRLHDDLPSFAEASDKFPKHSLDAYHLLHSYLAPNEEGKLRFKSVDELLSEDPPVFVEFDEPSPYDNTASLLESSYNDDLNSFFDNAGRHPVHAKKYQHWRPGEKLLSLTDSYVTADETYD